MRAVIGWRWLCLFCFAAGLVILIAFYLDTTAQAWIAEHQEAGLRNFMRGVSRFGDWPEHIVAGLVLLSLAYWRRNKKWMRIAAAMIVACALAGAAARVVKISTGRARPSVQTEAGWNGPNLSARYNAFPSGHTAASAAFFATLALACWRIGAPLLLIPSLIAFSRMYLAAHYLSDVVCAALIGILCAHVIAQLFELKEKQPKDSDRPAA